MRAQYPVSVACEVLQVSASGYFNWQRRPQQARPAPAGRHSDEALLAHMRAIHAEVKGEYGWPRMHKQLLARGMRVGKERVPRLMHQHGIKARTKRKFVVTTDSRHNLPVAPDLVQRQFMPDAPKRLWCSDMSAPCRRGLQRQEKGGKTVSEPKLADSRPAAEMLPRAGGGRAKGGRKAWPFADGWVSCAERPELYRAKVARSTRRATARSMVRQRSVRWKPLYLQLPTVGNDGDRGAIRPCLMFAAGGCDMYALDDGVLPWPSSRATRGRARHLWT